MNDIYLDCRLNSIGVGNENFIPDAQLSAYLSRDMSLATQARFDGNATSGWCGENDNSWIQVDTGLLDSIFDIYDFFLSLWAGVRCCASFVVRRSSCVNIFFSRTTGPILTQIWIYSKKTRNCKFHDNPTSQGEVILE